jgi:hypothetical protein
MNKNREKVASQEAGDPNQINRQQLTDAVEQYVSQGPRVGVRTDDEGNMHRTLTDSAANVGNPTELSSITYADGRVDYRAVKWNDTAMRVYKWSNRPEDGISSVSTYGEDVTERPMKGVDYVDALALSDAAFGASQQIEQAHATAVRADTMAKKIVGQTVRMARQGDAVKLVRRPDVRISHALREVDLPSATLALNAELQAQNHDIVAVVRPHDEGHTITTDYRPTIELLSIGGQEPPQR